MNDNGKIKLDENVYDDMRSGKNFKIFLNGFLVKTKYIRSIDEVEFAKNLMKVVGKNKLEDEIVIRFKFGILEQEIIIHGNFRVIMAEGWK